MALVTIGFDLWVYEINSLYRVLAESGGQTHAQTPRENTRKDFRCCDTDLFCFGEWFLDIEVCAMAHPITPSMEPV